MGYHLLASPWTPLPQEMTDGQEKMTCWRTQDPWGKGARMPPAPRDPLKTIPGPPFGVKMLMSKRLVGLQRRAAKLLELRVYRDFLRTAIICWLLRAVSW